MTPPSTGQSDCKATPVAELKFEAALAELEAIVRRMEDGQLPLEESTPAYRPASESRPHCLQSPRGAPTRIQVLENGVLRDFDPKQGETP